MGTLATAFNMLRAYCFVCTLFDCNHVKGWGSLAHNPTYSTLLLACFGAPQRGWQGVKERTKTREKKRTKRIEDGLIDQHATLPVIRALQCQYHSVAVNHDSDTVRLMRMDTLTGIWRVSKARQLPFNARQCLRGKKKIEKHLNTSNDFSLELEETD